MSIPRPPLIGTAVLLFVGAYCFFLFVGAYCFFASAFYKHAYGFFVDS